MTQRVLITGAAGYLGSNLVKYLRKHRPSPRTRCHRQVLPPMWPWCPPQAEPCRSNRNQESGQGVPPRFRLPSVIGVPMQVFTPSEVTKHATNKYLSVLVAAKYARVLNEFPRSGSKMGEKKLTTRALEELTDGRIEYRVVPRRRTAE